MNMTKYPSVLNPVGMHSRDKLPRIAPVRRLKSLKDKRILLFDNNKLSYGNSMEIFDTLEEEFKKKEGVKEIYNVRRRVTFLDLKTVHEPFDTLKPDGVVVALCDSGKMAVQTILKAIFYSESVGIPTVLLATKGMVNLCAMMIAPVCPSFAICELDDPIWCLPRDVIKRKTQEIFPEIVQGLTIDDDKFLTSYRLDKKYGSMIDYPSDEFFLKAWEGDDPSSYLEHLYERLCSSRLCDGLPVIPPTIPKVEEMLKYTDRDPEQEIVSCIPPGMTSITIKKLAINAVMAGCRPEYFPLIVCAYEAMSEEEFDLGSTVSTTYNGGHLILVSGPISEEVGLQSKVGCLGPGFRANATIGRAVCLSNMNVLRSFPGGSNVATFGSPSQYSYCFAEDLDSNPWKIQNEKDPTYITVFKCDSPHNVLNHESITPEGILSGIADEAANLAGNNAWWPGDLVVLLSPDHAKTVHGAGWSERDIKLYLYDHARNPLDLVDPAVAKRGIAIKWSPWFKHSHNHMIPVVYHPDDIKVVVAGGPGPHSMVMKPWGLSRSVTMPLLTKEGNPAHSITQFRR